MRTQHCLKPATLLLFLTGISLSLAAEKDGSGERSKGVQITQLSDRLRVELNGELCTEYFFKDVPRPYCYPLIGPGGVAMTRNWPMESPPNEEHDHPHHRSLWFAHGEINGHDFWSEAKNHGTTVHDGFDQVKSGKKLGIIKSHNKWVAADGTIVSTDERTIRIYNPKVSERARSEGGFSHTSQHRPMQSPKGAEQYARPAHGSHDSAVVLDNRMLDFEITLHASNGTLTLGDTKEGTMAVRMAETMKLKGPIGHGHIVNSAGVRDGDTWSKRADWCDSYGPVHGKTVGIAMFDHPKNPHHPTWWHVRDYGLFAANPFGEHDFEALKDKSAGNLVVPAGQSMTFRYRLYLHAGDDQQAQVAEKYQEYVKSGAK